MVRTKRELTGALRGEAVSVTEREYAEGTHWSVLPTALWEGYVRLYGDRGTVVTVDRAKE